MKKKIILLLTTVFLFAAQNLFASGGKESTEELTKTQSSTAIFLNSIAQAPTEDGEVGGTGDVRASCGWLYSNAFSIYKDVPYVFTATVEVGKADDTEKDTNGDKVRLYIVPVANDSSDFYTFNTGSSALIAIDGASASKNPYIEIPVGRNNITVPFTCDANTKLRFIFEKGRPDWSNANNSAMASQEVKISYVKLDYAIE